MEPGTAFTHLDLDAGERFVPLRRRLGVTAFGLNLLLLAPGQRGRVHAHRRQEEVYVVLEGTLTLELDGGEERRLGAGDVARVGPDVRRRLTNRGPARVALLAIGGDGAHAGRDGLAWDDWDDPGEPRSPADVPLRRPTCPSPERRGRPAGTVGGVGYRPAISAPETVMADHPEPVGRDTPGRGGRAGAALRHPDRLDRRGPRPAGGDPAARS